MFQFGDMKRDIVRFARGNVFQVASIIYIWLRARPQFTNLKPDVDVWGTLIRELVGRRHR
jgi:hypothetical protein